MRFSLKAAVGALAIGTISLIAGGGVAAAKTDASGGKGRVVIADFGGAYSKAIRDSFTIPFSKQSGYQAVVVDTLDRVQKPLAMIKANRVEWDIVEVNDFEYAELVAKGALEKLPSNVYATLKKALNPGTVTPYGVAISSYTNIVVCNKETVSKCPTTPKQFFDVKNYPGRRVVMKDYWLDNMSMAIQSLGVPGKKIFPMDVTRALNVWRTFKDNVQVFAVGGDDYQAAMRSREADMAIGADGRSWNLVKEGLNLSISYTGALYHVDYLVVLKKSPNPKGAFEFLKWYGTNPRAQANFAKTVVYGIPNPSAYKYLPASVARQLVDYPANKNKTVPTDLNWVYKNSSRVAKLWANMLAE